MKYKTIQNSVMLGLGPSQALITKCVMADWLFCLGCGDDHASTPKERKNLSTDSSASAPKESGISNLKTSWHVKW